MSWYVYPLDDPIDHEVSDECVCGPDLENVDGVWVVTHHALASDYDSGTENLAGPDVDGLV